MLTHSCLRMHAHLGSQSLLHRTTVKTVNVNNAKKMPETNRTFFTTTHFNMKVNSVCIFAPKWLVLQSYLRKNIQVINLTQANILRGYVQTNDFQDKSARIIQRCKIVLRRVQGFTQNVIGNLAGLRASNIKINLNTKTKCFCEHYVPSLIWIPWGQRSIITCYDEKHRIIMKVCNWQIS